MELCLLDFSTKIITLHFINVQHLIVLFLSSFSWFNPFSPTDQNRYLCKQCRSRCDGEPSHLDLHWLPFCSCSLTETLFAMMDMPKVRRNPLQKLGGERVNHVFVIYSFDRSTYFLLCVKGTGYTWLIFCLFFHARETTFVTSCLLSCTHYLLKRGLLSKERICSQKE